MQKLLYMILNISIKYCFYNKKLLFKIFIIELLTTYTKTTSILIQSSAKPRLATGIKTGA